jgi:hypothetical protein
MNSLCFKYVKTVKQLVYLDKVIPLWMESIASPNESINGFSFSFSVPGKNPIQSPADTTGFT